MQVNWEWALSLFNSAYGSRVMPPLWSWSSSKEKIKMKREEKKKSYLSKSHQSHRQKRHYSQAIPTSGKKKGSPCVTNAFLNRRHRLLLVYTEQRGLSLMRNAFSRIWVLPARYRMNFPQRRGFSSDNKKKKKKKKEIEQSLGPRGKERRGQDWTCV